MYSAAQRKIPYYYVEVCLKWPNRKGNEFPNGKAKLCDLNPLDWKTLKLITQATKLPKNSFPCQWFCDPLLANINLTALKVFQLTLKNSGPREKGQLQTLGSPTQRGILPQSCDLSGDYRHWYSWCKPWVQGSLPHSLQRFVEKTSCPSAPESCLGIASSIQ